MINPNSENFLNQNISLALPIEFAYEFREQRYVLSDKAFLCVKAAIEYPNNIAKRELDRLLDPSDFNSVSAVLERYVKRRVNIEHQLLISPFRNRSN